MATTRNNTTKKAPAAKTAPKTAAKPAPEKKTAAAPVPDEKDSEIEALKKQVEDMKALLETAARPQIVQIGGDAEKVSFLWQAEVADDNVVVFGDGGMYGRIVGKTGTFSVPKSDLSRLLDGMNRFFLDKRWLIALDGLTEEERRLYGVEYAEGEFIDEKLYGRLTRMGEDELLATYKALCPEWRRMIAIRFADAFEDKTLKVTRDALLALNKISRKDNKDLPKDDIRRKGAFWPIIQKLNFAEDSDIE